MFTARYELGLYVEWCALRLRVKQSNMSHSSWKIYRVWCLRKLETVNILYGESNHVIFVPQPTLVSLKLHFPNLDIEYLMKGNVLHTRLQICPFYHDPRYCSYQFIRWWMQASSMIEGHPEISANGIVYKALNLCNYTCQALHVTLLLRSDIYIYISYVLFLSKWLQTKPNRLW